MFQLFFYKIFPAEKPFLLSRDGPPHHSLKQTIFHLVTRHSTFVILTRFCASKVVLFMLFARYLLVAYT